MTMGTCTTTLPPPPDFNGHDYVDLGLPSGTLWATMNVGASKPSDAGLYFQWGDIVGYTKEQIGKDKQFNIKDDKWIQNTSIIKYANPSDTLELEDDAAHFHMGGDWHMPSPDQCQELIDSTTTAWTTSNGVSGTTFTSKKDASKSIFIPAAGEAQDGLLSNSGSQGDVWLSKVSAVYPYFGDIIFLESSSISNSADYRHIGKSVRGVIG